MNDPYSVIKNALGKEEYSEPCQTSMMEFFVKIVNDS